MKVLVPDSLHLDLAGLDGLEVVRFDRRAPLPEQHHDADGLVLWGVPRALLEAELPRLQSLRFVQALSAGVDHLLDLPLPPGARLYHAPGLHDRPVAEHALALMLAAAKRLHLLRDRQHQRQWRAAPIADALPGKRVLIWGFGRIGQLLGEMLLPLGVSVEGLRTRRGEWRGNVVYGLEDLEDRLPQADWLVMILPSTPQTRPALTAERLARLKPTAWVLNIGRGDAIDQAALLAALEAGRLGGACLDVTDPEPLPEDSPLWGRADVILTPHVASNTDDLEARSTAFLRANLERALRGEPMQGAVNLERGY
ncbi:phosphoglycerate dehydrogenase-like enzyme [Deinobacterium chartae]|uniref:Phosphoglycerate dehydrogenase-like enzyme n=1 Tax=Deinobacterium chartae TaxID=521158 RepID=A0A841HXG6_9DEIO|nr:NAD(P)-dependent oxidoreductase [Deinobacterium chartae]MBB6096598.1 phosphoglycerate dehydrogenase-like enzyme [Deinobacterium chartae]